MGQKYEERNRDDYSRPEPVLGFIKAIVWKLSCSFFKSFWIAPK